MNATDKQIAYALVLLDRRGYSTRYMSAAFKPLGATMRQRSGSVRAWLAAMDRREISDLIDRLK